MTVNPSSRRGAAPTRAALGLALGLTACGSGGDGGLSPPPPPPPPPATVIAAASPSGNNQSAKVGQALPDPLRVLVTRNGAPLASQTVNWQVTGGTATLNPGSGPTDAQGIASTIVTVGGTAAGLLIIQATTSGAA